MVCTCDFFDFFFWEIKTAKQKFAQKLLAVYCRQYGRLVVFVLFTVVKLYLLFFSLSNRKSFHLLKKNSKLLRELKNLDSRQW